MAAGRALLVRETASILWRVADTEVRNDANGSNQCGAAKPPPENRAPGCTLPLHYEASLPEDDCSGRTASLMERLPS